MLKVAGSQFVAFMTSVVKFPKSNFGLEVVFVMTSIIYGVTVEFFPESLSGFMILIIADVVA